MCDLSDLQVSFWLFEERGRLCSIGTLLEDPFSVLFQRRFADSQIPSHRCIIRPLKRIEDGGLLVCFMPRCHRDAFGRMRYAVPVRQTMDALFVRFVSLYKSPFLTAVLCSSFERRPSMQMQKPRMPFGMVSALWFISVSLLRMHSDVVLAAANHSVARRHRFVAGKGAAD